MSEQPISRCAFARVIILNTRSLAQLTSPVAPGKVFSGKEAAYCGRENGKLHVWAGRLAAKQAVAELLGLSAHAVMAEIEILPGPRGQPKVILHGGAKELIAQLGPYRLLVSISHIDSEAVAVCLLEPDS